MFDGAYLELPTGTCAIGMYPCAEYGAVPTAGEPDRLSVGTSPFSPAKGPASADAAPDPVDAASPSSPCTKLVNLLRRLPDTLSIDGFAYQDDELPLRALLR